MYFYKMLFPCCFSSFLFFHLFTRFNCFIAEFFVNTVKSEPIEEDEVAIREPPKTPTKKVVVIPDAKTSAAHVEKKSSQPSTVVAKHKPVDTRIKKEKEETVQVSKELPVSLPGVMDADDTIPGIGMSDFNVFANH